jgi:hypothetical protein
VQAVRADHEVEHPRLAVGEPDSDVGLAVVHRVNGRGEPDVDAGGPQRRTLQQPPDTGRSPISGGLRQQHVGTTVPEHQRGRHPGRTPTDDEGPDRILSRPAGVRVIPLGGLGHRGVRSGHEIS